MGFHEDGKWWVSPSNYAPEVVSKLEFPENIEILDTTLRDGEQQPSIIMTKDEKVAFALKLAETGVHRIEAGTPAVLKEDADAIREICAEIKRRGLKSKVYCFARCMKQDVQLAKDCGVDGILTEMVGSEQMLKYGKKWDYQKAVNVSVEASNFAHELGLKVTFFPADGSRADLDYLLNFVDEVKEKGHIDSVALVDTFGVLSPEGAAHRVRAIRSRFPDLPVECHFHDDFGIGVATTLAGLAAGASVAHVTVAGIGERSGSAQLEAVVMALKALYGIDVGIKTENFKSLAETLEEMSRVPIHPIRPIVGDKIFQWETGLPSSLWENAKKVDPLIMLPYHWSLTGHRMPRLLLGKKSGKDNVRVWLEDAGRSTDLSKEQMAALVNAIKEKSYSVKRDLTKEEFLEIIDSFGLK